MTKIPEIKLRPAKWIKWMARDKNLVWYGYSLKPWLGETTWLCRMGTRLATLDTNVFPHLPRVPWDKSLCRVKS